MKRYFSETVMYSLFLAAGLDLLSRHPSTTPAYLVVGIIAFAIAVSWSLAGLYLAIKADSSGPA